MQFIRTRFFYFLLKGLEKMPGRMSKKSNGIGNQDAEKHRAA
jgi:hypothetical protein